MTGDGNRRDDNDDDCGTGDAAIDGKYQSVQSDVCFLSFSLKDSAFRSFVMGLAITLSRLMPCGIECLSRMLHCCVVHLVHVSPVFLSSLTPTSSPLNLGAFVALVTMTTMMAGDVSNGDEDGDGLSWMWHPIGAVSADPLIPSSTYVRVSLSGPTVALLIQVSVGDMLHFNGLVLTNRQKVASFVGELCWRVSNVQGTS